VGVGDGANIGVMRRPLEFLRNNTPGAKPELWARPGKAIRRRLGVHLQGWIDADWWWRPCITTVGSNSEVLIEVVPGENQGRALLYYGVYELAPTLLVNAYLRKGDAFVDVGANIGYYALLAAHLVGPEGRVVAFEPVPRLRARLARSVALNEFAHVEIRPEVVGRARGAADLFEVVGGVNEGLSSTVREAPDALRVRHPMVPLDEVLANVKVQMMKVDVEGSEDAVFAGAAGVLSRPDAPAILFESFVPRRDHAILRGYGYSIHALELTSHGALRLVQPNEQPTSYRSWEAPNYFAVKSPRAVAFASDLSGRS
jgi:FkbM family methyltransferase